MMLGGYEIPKGTIINISIGALHRSVGSSKHVHVCVCVCACMCSCACVCVDPSISEEQCITLRRHVGNFPQTIFDFQLLRGLLHATSET